MKEPLDFDIHFMNIRKYGKIRNNGITIVFVMKGSVLLSTDDNETHSVTCEKDTLYIINRNVTWHMEALQDNVVLFFHLSSLLLLQQSEDFSSSSFSIENDLGGKSILPLRNLLINTTLLWLKKQHETWPVEVKRNLLDICCILLRHFKATSAHSIKSQYSERVSKVINILEDHWNTNIKVQDIAQKLYITTPHLSRQFSRETGISIQHYLTNCRFRHAVKDIAQTTHPISQIASENGFLSVKRLTALFRETWNMTPGEYRRKIKSGTLDYNDRSDTSSMTTELTEDISTTELFSLLTVPELLTQSPPATSNENKSEYINVRLCGEDTGHPLKQQHYVISVRSPEDLLKEHIQAQIIRLQEQFTVSLLECGEPLDQHLLPLQYIHTGETMPTWSVWDELDLAFRFLQKRKITPLFRLTVFTKDTHLQFSEYLIWLRRFIRHNIVIYGTEQINEWQFILDLRSLPTELSHKELVERCLELFSMLHQLLPHCRVGLSLDNSLLKEKYHHILSSNELMAFIHFLGISIIQKSHGNIFSSAQKERSVQEGLHQINATIQTLRHYGLHRPIWLEQWGSLTGNTLRTSGLFFRGALLMDTLLNLPKEITMLGFWLNSRLQNEVSGNHIIRTDSLSLFFNGKTRRPVFHVLSIKERLTGNIIDSGCNYIVTSHNDTIRLLLINPVTIDPAFSLQQHLLNDYTRRFYITLDLPENASGLWRIKQWIFDQKNGALYHQYGLQPTRYDRDDETMEYINRRSEPTLTVSDKRLKNHWYSEIDMDINAICLIELRKIS
ncbi:helix-turn-helix transcriptional regulator [Stenoxybacter acetivorans]|uniref:helix-turn-helix transcriptional regulator n=1 Tax=Stenoxybacter acetivorans TaxID=422441 RepID=UPI00055E043C|nr:helix-turn-helix domain-containing protein [Stenoxybacter acetivorans]